MDLGNLRPAERAVKKKKRVGRGPGSGHGKTACRGNKGQKARAGAQSRAWFEGGQMPLQRRLPKRGFNNPSKLRSQIVNVGDLARNDIEGEVTPDLLRQIGLVKRRNMPIKILGDGELMRPLTVKAHAFSRLAKEKIESIGGKVEVI